MSTSFGPGGARATGPRAGRSSGSAGAPWGGTRPPARPPRGGGGRAGRGKPVFPGGAFPPGGAREATGPATAPPRRLQAGGGGMVGTRKPVLSGRSFPRERSQERQGPGDRPDPVRGDEPTDHLAVEPSRLEPVVVGDRQRERGDPGDRHHRG